MPAPASRRLAAIIGLATVLYAPLCPADAASGAGSPVKSRGATAAAERGTGADTPATPTPKPRGRVTVGEPGVRPPIQPRVSASRPPESARDAVTPAAGSPVPDATPAPLPDWIATASTTLATANSYSFTYSIETSSTLKIAGVDAMPRRTMRLQAALPTATLLGRASDNDRIPASYLHVTATQSTLWVGPPPGGYYRGNSDTSAPGAAAGSFQQLLGPLTAGQQALLLNSILDPVPLSSWVLPGEPPKRLSDETLRGTPCHVYDLSLGGAGDVRLWFEAETGLPRRARLDLGGLFSSAKPGAHETFIVTEEIDHWSLSGANQKPEAISAPPLPAAARQFATPGELLATVFPSSADETLTAGLALAPTPQPSPTPGASPTPAGKPAPAFTLPIHGGGTYDFARAPRPTLLVFAGRPDDEVRPLREAVVSLGKSLGGRASIALLLASDAKGAAAYSIPTASPYEPGAARLLLDAEARVHAEYGVPADRALLVAVARDGTIAWTLALPAQLLAEHLAPRARMWLDRQR